MSFGAQESLSDVEKFNLFSGETDESPLRTPGYRYRAARLGSKLGGSRLGMSVYDLPPGEAIGPYHFERGRTRRGDVLSGRS
jgi:hypothetical protein